MVGSTTTVGIITLRILRNIKIFGMFKGYRNFVTQTAQQRVAMQDKEEWVQELHRFDFDRIHSVTNLRT